MPFGIQPIHIVVIVVVALLIFGPKRLPEMGRSIGRAINEFRNGTREVTDSLREEVNFPGEAGKTTTPVNPAPAMVTEVPPVVSPVTGVTALTTGPNGAESVS